MRSAAHEQSLLEVVVFTSTSVLCKDSKEGYHVGNYKVEDLVLVTEDGLKEPEVDYTITPTTIALELDGESAIIDFTHPAFSEVNT